MSQGLRRPSGPITPNQPIEQVHTAMRAMTPAIKNATDAKSHLFTNSWALPGEEITLETLARTLFSVVANNPKITPALANPILAVAYLITEKVEECAVLNITSSITKHLLDAFIPISTDIQTRLENHIQAITESNKSHNALAEKLLNTQEKLDKTSEKISTNARTYSQVAAHPVPPTDLPQRPPPIRPTPNSRSVTEKKSKDAKFLSVSPEPQNSPLTPLTNPPSPEKPWTP